MSHPPSRLVAPRPTGITALTGPNGSIAVIQRRVMQRHSQAMQATADGSASGIAGADGGDGDGAASSLAARVSSLEQSSRSFSALASQLQALEARLAAQAAHSHGTDAAAEEERAGAVNAMEERVTARVRQVERRCERFEHTTREALSAARIPLDAQSAAPGARQDDQSLHSHLQQLERSLTAHSARHDGDLDAALLLLHSKLADVHSRMATEHTARVRAETDLRRFVALFQTEFRSIVRALQSGLRGAHTKLEQALGARMTRAEKCAAAAANAANAATSAGGQEGSANDAAAAAAAAAWRTEMQRGVNKLASRVDDAAEAARIASAQSVAARARADQAFTEAVNARERAVSATAVAAAATRAVAALKQQAQPAKQSNATPSSVTLSPPVTAGSTSPPVSSSFSSVSVSTSPAPARTGAHATGTRARHPNPRSALATISAPSSAVGGSSFAVAGAKSIAANSVSSAIPALPAASSPPITTTTITAASRPTQHAAHPNSGAGEVVATKPVAVSLASASAATAIKSQIKLPVKTSAPHTPSTKPPTGAAVTASVKSPVSPSDLDRDAAAVRIQSVYRGHRVRRGQRAEAAAELDQGAAINTSRSPTLGRSSLALLHKPGDLLIGTLESLAPDPTPLCDPDAGGDGDGRGALGSVVAVSAGLNHAAAIDTRGRVWLWGDNSCGQAGMGEGDRTARADPTLLPPLGPPGTRVVQVVCAHEHTLLLLSDGSVYAAGSGMLGRLGLPSDADQEAFQRVPLPAGVRGLFVAAGQYNSGIIASPPSGGVNHVYTFGANSQGQCGLGHRTPVLQAARVPFPAGVSIEQIAFGDKHGLARCDRGRVWVWGSDEYGQISLESKEDEDQLTSVCLDSFPHPVVSVAAGERHSHLLTADGSVWSMGSGEAHQQGVWDNVDQRHPIRMDSSALPPDARVVSVSTGSAASFAVLESGAVYSWGYGVGSPVPVLQSSLQGTFVQSVGVGSNDNVVVLTGAAQEVFRVNFDGTDETDEAAADSADAEAQEASGLRPAPWDLLRGRRIVSLAVGASHGLAVDQRGGLVAWGANGDFQCGTGNTFDLPLPITVSCPVALVSVACSAAHSLALASDGSVWSWGNGMSGRCGVGRDGDVERPTRVDFPRARDIPAASSSSATPSAVSPSLEHDRMVLIAVGAYNSGSVSSRGEVWTWGAGDGGQIGLPGFAPQLRPVRVPIPAASSASSPADPALSRPSPTHIVSLAFGNKHGAAVCRDGAAYMWGSNEFGQLSLGSIDAPGAVHDDGSALQHLPAAVRYLASTPLRAVACGENNTFFVGRDSGLYACGAGETGQLGSAAPDDGSPAEDQSLPLPIAAFSGVQIRSLAVGSLNCAAVTEPLGALWSWGWSVGAEPKEWSQLQGKDVR